MRRLSVIQGALLLSLAGHLALLATPQGEAAPPVNRPQQELLPIRLIAPPQPRQPQSIPAAQPPVAQPLQPLREVRPQQPQAEPAPVAAVQQSSPRPLTVPQPSVAPPTAPAAAPAPPVAAEPARPQPQPTALTPRRDEYLAFVRSQVERNREYPSFSRQTGQQGSVLVKITIRADGSAEEVGIAHPSGHRQLDKAALLAVKNAAPFRPPTQFGLQRISIEIPIVYKLN